MTLARAHNRDTVTFYGRQFFFVIVIMHGYWIGLDTVNNSAITIHQFVCVAKLPSFPQPYFPFHLPKDCKWKGTILFLLDK